MALNKALPIAGSGALPIAPQTSTSVSQSRPLVPQGKFSQRVRQIVTEIAILQSDTLTIY